MITVNKVKLQFSNMGLFSVKEAWIHPDRVIDSYELIYVLAGNFRIKEGDEIYELRPKSLLLLEPGIRHCGLEKSRGEVKFYWIHFYCDDFSSLGAGKYYTSSEFDGETNIFRELMSIEKKEIPELCDIKLAEILYRLSFSGRRMTPKLVSEVVEYIRINSNRALDVRGIAREFSYSMEHLSRLVKKHTGMSLHALINDMRVKLVKTYLCNTNFTVKQIASTLNFEDENNFVKFFKYHVGESPSDYRKRHNDIHMNKK